MPVKEKNVELIELFYDLIFVYGISRLTTLIGEPINGFISSTNLFMWIITSFVLLQAWLYFTNYVNRYGKWKWYEYILACINMIAVIYMTNTISTNWQAMAFPFNLSMLIILLTVIILYSIPAIKEKSLKGAAGNSITILSIVCTIYIIAIICKFLNFTSLIIWINVIAVITGAFLPFFIQGKFDKSIISFPHLVERFELLTIITFGEAIVGMTHFFDVGNFNIIPILIFAIIITMFGGYVVQIHNLVDHHREERSLRLMFSHYFIVISINLITIVFELIHTGEVNHLLAGILTVISLSIFYISIMANSPYHSETVNFRRNDALLMILFTLIGSMFIFLFLDNFGFLIGVLIITLGNLSVLVKKDKESKLL